jgi:uncharacterized membrane protein
MTSRVIELAAMSAGLGSGVIAGVLFAFSSFVMRALARLPPDQGIAAMQAINLAVISRWFMMVFLGTAALCVALAVTAAPRWHEPGAGLRLAGALCYLVGTIGVTMACNVPRNVALAELRPGTSDAATLWTRYVASWTVWNHARTAAALIAAAALTWSAKLP